MSETSTDLVPIVERRRIPAPANSPQSLVSTDDTLWVGSFDTGRVYDIAPETGAVHHTYEVPGKPIGATFAGEAFRYVVSENGDADNRVIRRFTPARGFAADEAWPCPDDTGSFLAFDGESLWLSQRYNKRILRLDANGMPSRTINVGTEIIGMTFVGTRLYFSLWLGAKTGRCRIGHLDPRTAQPALKVVATMPFVGVSLAFDGVSLWTNDFKNTAIVAFAPTEAAA